MQGRYPRLSNGTSPALLDAAEPGQTSNRFVGRELASKPTA